MSNEEKKFGYLDQGNRYVDAPEGWYDTRQLIVIPDFEHVKTYSDGQMFEFELLGQTRSIEILKKEKEGSIIIFRGISGNKKVITVEFDEFDPATAEVQYNAQDAAA